MSEARAAFHLGFLDSQSLPTTPTLTLSTSLDLVNRLLARTDPSGELLRKAYRLKFQIYDRRGQSDLWQTTYNALPSSLPDISSTDWTQQKLLWSIIHSAELYDWGGVKSSLAHYNAAGLKGEAKADYIRVKCRSDIRNGAGAQGYLDLATAIANDASWDIADPYFDPYYGQTDFSQLDSWALIQPLLQLLGSNPQDQNIGLRRWFEFAAPSALNPLGSLFPDAPAQARAALIAEFRQKALAFAPDPNTPVPSTGGYRELLANAIRMENLAYTGRAHDILVAEQNLTATISGIPDPVWNAFRAGWKMFGWGGTLAIGNALDASAEIRAATNILPPSPFRAFVLDLFGLLELSQSNPDGNVQFARAFLIAISHPLIVDQMIKGVTTNTTGLQAQAVLDVLAQPPYQPDTLPQTLGARSLFGIRHVGKFAPAQQTAVLVQAIKDGANALDILEQNMDPAQAAWRDTLRDPLIQTVGIVDGPNAAQRAASEFTKAIRRNSAFAGYLSNPGGPSNSVSIILSVVSEFDLLAQEIKNGDPATSGTLLRSLDSATMASALASLPENFIHPFRVRVGRAIVDESDRRALDGTGWVSADWRRVREKRDEILLNWSDRDSEARAELQTLTTASDADTTTRLRAQTVLDALGPMQSPAAYNWAQGWLTIIEKEYPKRTHLFDLLAGPLSQAAGRSDVAAYLAALPPWVRSHHLYNIAQAFRNMGDEASAIDRLNQVISMSDAELEGDEVIRYVAESQRLGTMWSQSLKLPALADRQVVWRTMIEYARQRLSTIRSTDENRFNLAAWGFTAANQLQDEAAKAEFSVFLQSAPKTRMF